jgi:beta-lactamase superfamily II metal-dependent hydrolase
MRTSISQQALKMILMLVVVSSVGAFVQSPSQSLSTELNIVHFDVGNGDSTLIVVGDGSDNRKSLLSVLIDAGSRSRAANVVIRGIHEQKIEALDYIIATHNDADLRAGLAAVLQSIHMTGKGAFYDRDRSWKSGKEGAPLKPGMSLPIDFQDDPLKLKDKFDIKCVALNGNTTDLPWNYQKSALNENARSVALIVTFGKFRYFIGGNLTGGGPSGWNASPDIESRVAAAVGQVAVLRVNHHGSITSTNAVFLAALNPVVAIISAGPDPKTSTLFHWPSQKVILRLSAVPHVSAIYVTGKADTNGLADQEKKKLKDGQGNITISTNGEDNFKVNGDMYRLP